ncbi:MAG: glycosyltransferase family 2 protein [Candidatus Gracilibacteria bacterium]
MISIVIPTYNRADVLKECLECLSRQTCAATDFEVVVVNDGGTDATADVVNSFITQGKISVRYFEKNNEGQGIARNVGVKEAKGEIIAFIGDDIFVKEDFVQRHLDMHKQHPEENAGVLGFIDWDPRTPDMPLYRFMTNGSIILGRFGGHQFAYEKLDGKTEASYDFFYTSNISLKKSLLEKFPFDESFLKYGWEDIELGYRLAKEAGFQLFYDRQIFAYHYHLMDEEGLKKRMFAIGKAAVLFDRKYPELGKVPSPSKQFLFTIFSSTPLIVLFDYLRKTFGGSFYYWYYYAISKKYFLEGLHQGLKEL